MCSQRRGPSARIEPERQRRRSSDNALSMPPETAFALVEKANQGVEMAAVGRYFDQIDAGRARQLPQRRAALLGAAVEVVAHLPVAGVEQQALARFGVLDFEQTNRRQVLLAGVGDAHRD